LLQTQTQTVLPLGGGDGSASSAAQLLHHSVGVEPGLHDEMRDADGRLRPAWQAFVERLPLPGGGGALAEELNRRVNQVTRQIRRDGITHNVFGEQGAAPRPWALELLPLLIDAADWAAIEAGVVQRARLMQAMLADCYAAQRLLHDGLLPPALLLRHPGYLREMRGVEPASGMRLHVVAFDLAHRGDGRWQVVARRCQGPSGLGYVLHNRLVVSHEFPDAFRELRIQHIASSYRRLLDSIETPARQVAGGHAPRVVLLTPGRYSETYFEHAYLARYLGLPLVEGGDLVVREQRLYLKTVEGLEPVHGMLRRLDDEWCDPLELRADSALGVPGLLQVLRAGRLVMANALGSGFLESPALQGFLPGIARRLLGEELLLPGLPSWWCGEAAAWRDVRDRLDDKVVRSTFPSGGRASAIASPEAACIDDDPDACTVTERVRLSRAPVWSEGMLLARPAMVRVYAIAGADGSWHVLPGGMTRVARHDDSSVSMQRGGSSLDTWVITEGPVDAFSMLPRRLSVDDIAARRPPVPSRTAENLFWLGRYTERTEQQVRLARASLSLVDTDDDTPPNLRAALSDLAVQTGLAPYGVPTLNQSPALFERALLAALADPQSGSIAFNQGALERSAAALRERLSTEQWVVIRSMGESIRQLRAGFADAPPGQPAFVGGGAVVPDAAQALAAIDRVGVLLAAVTGAQTDRMTRDHGWRFLTAGRLIERLIGLTAQIGAFAAHGALATVPAMAMLLELFDSAITFRARYHRHEDLLALTDLLVLDSANPRSLAGVLRRLRTELGKLPGPQTDAFLAMLPAEGAGVDLGELRGADDAALQRVLGRLSGQLHEGGRALADALGHRYFAHAAADEEVRRV
jgi:uncharacterized circularly permuted ATP-grasp superfamily protein/uncharacterized alpha-E superfamily protein